MAGSASTASVPRGSLSPSSSPPRHLVGSQARFPALVLAADRAERHLVAEALNDVGASNLILAAEPKDILTHCRLPAEPGVGAICMAPQDGSVLQLVTELRHRGWRRLVMVSPRWDGASVRLAIAAKVRCFVGRRSDHSDVAATELPRQRAGEADSLSEREIQVLQSVANGHSNKQVGEELGLSGLTVKSHLARIGRKLGTGDRAHMVAIAMRSGYIR